METVTENWWQRHKPSKRRLIQLYSALLYNAHLRGFIDGEIYQGKVKYACVPGFNCYSCPGAVGACPLGALQNALASSGHRAGFYVFGMLMLFGIILGRTICGWLCPLGLVQELLHHIPTYKIKKNRVTRFLSYCKYVFLAVFALAIPLYYGIKHDLPMPGFCKFICPAGTFEGAIGLLSNPVNSSKFSMLGIFFTRKFVILLIIILACIFCYRSFCRFVCPLGAIYGIFNKYCLVGVKVDMNRCNGCGLCVSHCGMDVKRVGDHECINCGKCMEVCHQKAISMKAGKITLMAPQVTAPKNGGSGSTEEMPAQKTISKGTSRLISLVAAAVLVFALIWFNFLDPTVKARHASAEENTVASETVESTEKSSGTESGGAPSGGDGKEAGVSGETEKAESSESSDGKAADSSEDKGDSDGKAADSSEDKGDSDGKAANGSENTGDGGKSANSSENTGDSDSKAVGASASTDSTENTGAESFESTAPIGNEVGMQLKDFSIKRFDGSEFNLKDTRGKITFINLWATHCTACVKELPFFCDLYKAHEGEIEILAVHDSFVLDDPVEYVNKNKWDIPFATDTEDKLIWDIVGASSTLPQTIVLDRKGDVIYNQSGSVTPEVLESLYKKADEAVPKSAGTLETKDTEPADNKGSETTDNKDTGASDSKAAEASDSKDADAADSKAAEASDSKDADAADSKAAEATDSKDTESTDSKDAGTADSVGSAENFESTAPVGQEVDMQLKDFSVKLFDGSEFNLKDTRGKITFINLWATHCTACVKELPFFCDLYKAHEGDIAVLAVHDSFVLDDPVEYVNNNKWDIPFATDTEDKLIWNIVGASSTLPQTIVLNRKGEIIYNQTGSVTPEMLEALYKKADN